MSTQVVLLTSLKGGCGKSTVCAHLADALAGIGKKILMISLDKYNSSLDIIFSCGSCLFDISDYPEKKVEEICIPITKQNEISLALFMPYSENECGIEKTVEFIKAAKECEKYDFILIDKGFDSFENLYSLSEITDRVCIISTQMTDSLRSAELLGDKLFHYGMEEEKMSLILNPFYTEQETLDFFPGISQIISQTKISIIGIIPFSDELHAKQTSPAKIKDTNIKSAFFSTASRILGQEKKFLTFISPKNRKSLLNNKCSGGNKI